MKNFFKDRESKNRFYEDMHKFLEDHKHADEIKVDALGYPTEALYYSPYAKMMEITKTDILNKPKGKA